jgi:hypothetical protein
VLTALLLASSVGVAAPATGAAVSAPALQIAQAEAAGGGPITTKPAPDQEPVSAPAPAAPQAQPPAGRRFPAAEAGGPVRLGQTRYYISRWAEDWSYLRDPAKAKGPLDRLKFIPLNRDKSVYLTLSGSLRLGFNSYDNPGLNTKTQAANAFLDKVVVGADLHVGPHLRFYGELASSGIGGQGDKPLRAYSRSDLYVQQAFAELNGRVAGADSGVRVGRQEFTDGPEEIVSIRDIPNLHYEFDGVRAWANWSRVRIDLIDFSSLRYDVGVLTTSSNLDEHLSGVNTSFVLPPVAGSELFFDPFYFNYRNAAKKWGTTVGHDDIAAYGARLHGNWGRLKFDWSGERQTGQFADRPVEAFAIYSSQSWLVANNRFQPRVGFHADVASGGGAFGKGTLHDADFLFGQSPYFSDGLFVVGQNLIDFAPNVSFNATRKLNITAEYEKLWRYDDHDAVYPSSKVPYAGTQLVPGSDIGALLRLRAKWAISPRVTLSAATEYLQAGEVLKEARFKDSLFTGAYLTLRL